MTHLTTKQIVQFTDGTLDYASQAQCTGHLAVCERCRKEIELQKAISKNARRQTLAQPASGFVQRIMERIVPQPQKTWKSRLVDNLGNVFAMAMVLAILGYAVSNPSLFQIQQQSSQPSIIPQVVTDTYVKFVQSISQHTNEVTQQVATSTGRENSNMITLTFFSLLLLVAIDQFIVKRYIGMNMKH